MKWGLAWEAVTKLAGLRSDEDTLKKKVLELVSQWMELAGAGLTLISGNQKLRNIDDYNGFWDHDGESLVRIILSTRKRLLDSFAKIEKIVDSIEVSSQDASAAGLLALLHLEVPPPMKTELDSEKFDDIISFKAAQLSNKLETFTQLQGFDTKQYANEEKKCWKQDLREDATLAELQEASQATLARLPGKSMKDAVDEFMQVGLQGEEKKWSKSGRVWNRINRIYSSS